MTTPIEDDGLRAAEQWRDLALQFDGHRIEALEYLRTIVHSIERYATVRDILREPLASLKVFLASPPLSGEAVLAERLAALRSSPAVDGVGEPVPIGYAGQDAIDRYEAGDSDGFYVRSKGVDYYLVPLYTRSALSPTSDRASVVEECAKMAEAVPVDDADYGAAYSREMKRKIVAAISALSPRSS